MIDKLLSLESLQFRIRRTADWRRTQAALWSDDPRNARAAAALALIANDNVASVDDAQWKLIEPYYERANFKDTIDELSREIEFKSRAKTISEYISLLAKKVCAKAAA